MSGASLPGSGGPLLLKKAYKERGLGQYASSTTAADVEGPTVLVVSCVYYLNIDSSHPQLVPWLVQEFYPVI